MADALEPGGKLRQMQTQPAGVVSDKENFQFSFLINCATHQFNCNPSAQPAE
jgi:hypothetical protein